MGVGLDITGAMNVNRRADRLLANYRAVRLNGGTMSDYDMENCYPSCGIFSEATQMSGSMQTASLAYEFLAISNAKKDVTFSVGYEYRSLELNPSNLYQVYYFDSSTNGVYYDSGQNQNTRVKVHGLQLGSSYKNKISENHNLIFSGEVFIPFSFESKQYNWGYNNDGDYDWKMSKSGARVGYGLRAKIQNQVKLSHKVWWNIFTFAEMTSINAPLAQNRYGSTIVNNGYAKDVKIFHYGIGTGLTFN